MKLTSKQLTEFLSSLAGEDVEVVEDDSQSDFNRESALEKIDNTRKPILRSLISDELRSEIEPSIAGKFGGTLERALIRETGIDAKAFTKDMKDADKIKLAIEFKAGQLDKDKSEWQNEIRRMAEEREQTIQEWQNKVAETEKTWKGKYNQKEIHNSLFSELQKAPLNPKADKSALSKDFYAHMSSKYNLSYDEVNSAIQFFKLDNPDMPAESDAPNGKIDIMKEAEAYFKPRGLWETNTSNLEMPNVGNNYVPTAQQQGHNAGTPEALKATRQAAYEKAGLTTS